jgi:hypothetical protein
MRTQTESIARRAAKDITKGYDIKVRIEMAIEQALAQRTWVGLTDEEIDKAWRSVDYTVPWEQHRIDIAKAIEAKLKEKNT